MVHPCLSDRLTQKAEASVGDKQPRRFVINQQVAVRDFRPHCPAKWYRTTILKCLGPLTYEVTKGGKPCKVHVDHLRPWQDEQAKPNTGTEEITVNVAPDVEDEPLVSPEDEGNTSDVLSDRDVSRSVIQNFRFVHLN